MYKDLLTKEELAALLDLPEHDGAEEGKEPAGGQPTVEQLARRVRELEEQVELLNRRMTLLEAGMARSVLSDQVYAPTSVSDMIRPAAEPAPTAAFAQAAASLQKNATTRAAESTPAPSPLPSRKEKFGSRKSWFSF